MRTPIPMQHDLIPADVRARLGTLRLAMRQPAGAQGYGVHHSNSRGAGLEFAQYRAYEPGDALRQVDWKLYARSDKFFVREAERDSPLTLWLLVDASASMGQSDATRPGWSRLDAAKAIAACAIELALRQGDRFGIAVAGGDGVHAFAAGSGPRHRDRCLLELQRLSARGSWPDETRLRPLWEQIGPRSLVLLLSDCFDDAVVSLAERLAAARRDVASVQVLTVEERDFPFRGGQRFRDPETGEERLADGAAARDEFLACFTAARDALAARLAASGIRHVGYVLDEPLDAPLRRLFATRDRHGGGTGG
ncbi:MAG: DUF58 domain-containing protein [Luteimonas sp.]